MVAGREKPVRGRPEEETGRTDWFDPPPVFGAESEVPGRGIEFTALSSRRSSPTKKRCAVSV